MYVDVLHLCCKKNRNSSYLPRTKEKVNAFARVCLLARLLKNACVDLDEMLRVDMDELVNF